MWAAPVWFNPPILLGGTRHWFKRARSAEIHNRRLLARLSRLDRAISSIRGSYLNMVDMWRRAMLLNLQHARCADDAERVLRRYKRGMPSQDAQKLIDDALAFLGAMEGRKAP